MINKTKVLTYSLAIMMVAASMLTGCIKDKCSMTYEYMKYEPIYMSHDEFVSSVAVEPAQALVQPGKIFAYGDYLFVSEYGKGVHIIDNSNTSSPNNIGFINIPGNYDIAIDCNKLYADSGPDLLVFDLNNVSSPVLVNRASNALPNLSQFQGYQADPSLGVVVRWEGKVVTGEYDDCNGQVPDLWTINSITNEAPANSIGNNSRGGSSINGMAGSMSRFGIQNNHLYVVTPQTLRVFDIQSCTNPVAVIDVDANNWGVWGNELETIFPHDDKLFIGSRAGMFIVDASAPSAPVLLSNFQHATACDPVVVSGDYAYVTLHTDFDNRCRGFSNQLDVVNISNPSNPILSRTYPMHRPQGVGVDTEAVFLCDGEEGIKVFDASNPESLEQIAHHKDMHAYDVIPFTSSLIVVGDDGISQYDYSDPKNLRLLSTIPVTQ